MAQCKDCIHYDMCKYRPLAIGVDTCDVFRNTSDIVPKSEVERLSKELDELAEEYSDLIVEKDRTFDEAEVWYKKAKELEVELDAMRSAANSYKMHYNNLAREIVEEIERLMENNEVYFRQTDEMQEEFAELKKKYTEEPE